jgi:hypothetical protein
MKRIRLGILFVVLAVFSFSFLEYPVRAQEKNPSLKIGDFSFKEGNLSFQISNFLLNNSDDKLSGQVQIKIKVTDKSNNPLFDQGKLVNSPKSEMHVTIPLKMLKDGEYSFFIEAADILAHKKATLVQKVQLVEGTQIQMTVDGFAIIDYFFGINNLCPKGDSPRIALKNVPEGTNLFKVEVTNLDKINIPHGGGIVKYEGKEFIKAGALQTYLGPCPTKGATHRYSIVVYAMDSNKQTLAKAELIKPYISE